MERGEVRYERRLAPVVMKRMRESPVLLLEGLRSVGKSTLLAEIGSVLEGARRFDLDDHEVLELVRTSRSLVTGEQLPVLIDEYQKLPELLNAIKARLNRGARPGMFILAGSASYDSLPSGTQALTGRIQRVPVWPLAQVEIDGGAGTLLAGALEGEVVHSLEPATATRADYVERILRGGMPLALMEEDEAARRRWFTSYVTQSLQRDAGELRRIDRLASLPALLARAVGQTGQVLNTARVGEGLGMVRNTAASYLGLLEALFLIHLLPAWGTTVSSRSIAAPKVHVVDSGVGGYLLRLSPSKLERGDPSSWTGFGHLLESFVVQEVMRQVSWLDEPVTMGHWRTRDDDEVDLVLERYDGGVVGIEVQAGDHVEGRKLSGLRKLRSRLGGSFVAGIVFHLGGRGYEAEDRIHVLPVERLWVP